MIQQSQTSYAEEARIAVRKLLHDPLWQPAAAMLVTFAVLKWLFFNGTPLTADEYRQPVLSWAFLKSLTHVGVHTALIAIVVVPIIIGWRRALKPWSSFDHGRELRVIAVVSAAVLAWPTVAYPENLYFSHSHLADRILVAASFGLLCWRPVFVALFLVLFYIVSWQFELPLSGYSWAATDLPKNLLVLTVAAHLLSLHGAFRPGTPFLFCMLCLAAAHYWPSGFGKLRMGWLFHDHVELLLPATYANGWLAMLSVDQVESTTRFLAGVRPFLKLFTFVIECGALFFLARRSVALVLLPAWCLFHAGVFLLAGICFWQWVIVDLCLLILIWKSPAIRNEGLFRLPRFAVASALIFTAPLWLRGSNLSWYDSPANYVFRFEAVGESGKRYPVHPAFFAPYEYTFTESGFGGVSPSKMLSIYWGATSRDIAEPLIETGTPEGFFAMEQKRGRVRYREDTEKQLEAFLKTFARNYNQRLATGSKPASPWAPFVLWTLRQEGGYNGQESIRRINVAEVVSFFDGESYREIRNTPLMSVDIPGS